MTIDTNGLQKRNPAAKLMTLSEVAGYLQVAERTVLKMIHRKEIPSIKVGNQWRFFKEVIDKWLLSKMQPVKQDNDTQIIATTEEYIPVDRLLQEDSILMDLKPGKKEEVLHALIQPLVDKGLIKDKKRYLSRLLQRENIISTGLERGIAIPHIRNISENPPGINTIIAGLCREGTDFSSMDKKKTHLFFLVCSDNEILHIRIIARLSLIFKEDDIISRFISAKTRQEFLNLFIKISHKFNFSVKQER